MFSRAVVVSNLCKFQNMAVRNMQLVSQNAYVDGNWVNASSNETFAVTNPADNSVFSKVPNMSVIDVSAAIDKAYEAFHTWQETTAKERSHILRNWYNLMETNSEEIARIMTLESGKPIRESRAEVSYGNSYVEFYSEEARRVNGEIIQSPVKSKHIFIHKQPIGVAALITPWNFPHAMITRKAAAALAAGCTCIVKPAEDTPLTALAIAKLSHEAGIPKGVFNVVTSNRNNSAAIGKLLCTSPKIAGISFTGSTEVGKLLYAQCAQGIKRIGLELGGNAPFIVFASADIDAAVKGAVASKFRNSGQTCVSANRFIIHASIFNEFINKFKHAMQDFIIGYGLNEEVTSGPLINHMQAQKVDDFVKDAVKKGAKIVIGGSKVPELGELYYQPTLLTNITSDMKVYNEEVFGPVAACIEFKTEEEALQIANATSRGLAGYFYSKNISQIFRVAKTLEVGMVGVNEGLISTAEAPFGGLKESGIGREGGSHGIDEYLYVKYMCLGNL